MPFSHTFLLFFRVPLQINQKNLDSENARAAIAALIYVFRLLLLSYLHRNIPDLKFDNISVDTENFHVFTTINNHTAFSVLSMTQKLCKTIAENSYGLPNFVWNSSFGDLDIHEGKVNGKTVSLSMLKLLCKNLLKDIKSSMESFFEGFNHTNLMLQHFKESVQNSNPKYCFMADLASNSVLRKSNEIWLAKVAADVLMPDGSVKFIEAKRFIRKSAELLNLMLVYVHVTSGQPARATELATYIIKNTTSRERTVKQMSDSNVVLHQQYSKHSQITATNVNILRFLDPTFALLFNKYLAFIRPTLYFLIGKIPLSTAGQETPYDILKRSQAYSTYLWVSNGSSMDDYEIRRRFASIFGKYTQSDISFGEYRHAAIAFMNAHLKYKIIDHAEDFDEQAGHSTTTASKHYARTDFSFGGESQAQYEKQLMLCQKWWHLLGIVESTNQEQLTQLGSNPNNPITVSDSIQFLQQSSLLSKQVIGLAQCKYIFKPFKLYQDIKYINAYLINSEEYVIKSYNAGFCQ